MNKNIYSEEDLKYSKIISALKNLPKEKAPDNFEYNLMIKIQNGQFESNLRKKKSTGKFWIFIPGTAVALSTILLFIIFSDFSSKEKQDISIADLQYISRIHNAKEKDVTSVESNKVSEVKREMKNNEEVLPNDVIETETTKYPFNQNYSVDVDSYIDGNKGVQRDNANNPSVLASSGLHYPEYNGFYLRQREIELIRLYKARLDSIAREREKLK